MQQIGNLIFDDDGFGINDGSLALINGKHERVIHLEGDAICIHGWPEDELVFAVNRIDADPQRDDWPDSI